MAGPDPRSGTAQRGSMRALTITAAVALIGAILLALATDETTLDAIALSVGGGACVLVVCVAFFAVGRSEDEQRARDKEPS